MEKKKLMQISKKTSTSILGIFENNIVFENMLAPKRLIIEHQFTKKPHVFTKLH